MPPKLDFKTTMNFEYGVAAPVLPGIVRVVANNGGPLTFHGTNSYLVGTTELAVIDPGPSDAGHVEAILRAAGGRPITHILVTHRHRDHVDGASRLARLTGAVTCAFNGRRKSRGLKRTGQTQNGFVNTHFSPDRELKDGDVVDGADWRLRAVHTPGHAPDHLCFSLEGRRVLFSGDHVMAWNTTVIAPPEGRMADYLRSLESLLLRNDDLYLPGHGGRLENPARTVRAYLLHRRWREQAILHAIRNGTSSVKTLASEIYTEVDDAVSGAAVLSVFAHVEFLHERGLVRCETPLCLESQLYPA